MKQGFIGETRAWIPGEGGTLHWSKTPLREPGRHSVLIAVRAAGVNRPDLLQRAGLYPPPPGASEALGLEVAGVVEAVGDDVTRFRPGDPVMALVAGGGCAEHCLADEGTVIPLPNLPGGAHVPFSQAAAFPETAFTVWANVFGPQGLKPGERLFVHGGTSGIGTMAASIAHLFGHEVFGTAGSAQKVSRAEAHGFKKVWNYNEEDWSTAMADLGGCDLVLDMVGGDYVPRNLAMLRQGGRHVSIAFLGGIEARFNVMDVMRRRLTLTGSTLRARSLDEKSALRAEVEANLLPLMATGRLKPLVSMELPMGEVEEAHKAMQSGALMGKAVLINP